MHDTNSALTTEQVREACRRLERAWDSEGLTTLMTRYLAQPLSDSETAWAYMNLANAHAWGGRPAQSVSAHEAFEGWLPGRTPKLPLEWPHYPPAEDSTELALGPDEIRLMFLGQSVEFATAYGATGRYSDFVAKADAALTGLKPTEDNLELRFYTVRIFLDASQVAGDFVRADQ